MASAETVLDDNHRGALHRAIRNVLDSDLALQTYSQIVDGLPVCGVASDRYGDRGRIDRDHPIVRHTSPCPGAADATRRFLSALALDRLGFDDKLLGAFQSASFGHRRFQCRLIELIAVAVHKIAVLLFLRGDRIHDRETTDPAYTIDSVTAWLPNYEWLDPRGLGKISPPPTLFMHASYGVSDQYPDGMADVVGYWAENRILGGVVLFDRSEAWDDGFGSPEEPNVYFHSDRRDVTFRVWQALDEQQQALFDFLMSSPAGSPTAVSVNGAQVFPLPLSATDENMNRLHPKDATGNMVYRDIWERAPDDGFRHCVKNPLDYPEYYKSMPRPPEEESKATLSL